MLLGVNPDACSPVSKASHTHGNAHTIKKLLWEKSAGLSPWMTELQETMWKKQTGSFSLVILSIILREEGTGSAA